MLQKPVSPPAGGTSREYKAEALGGLSTYDMPEYFLAVDHIPSTPSGKMRKRDLVEAVEQGRLNPIPIRWQTKQQASR